MIASIENCTDVSIERLEKTNCNNQKQHKQHKFQQKNNNYKMKMGEKQLYTYFKQNLTR